MSGFEYSQPYYWNIAPHREATITPTLLTRRGVDVAGEFRYLERDYGGKLTASLMPQDRLRDRNHQRNERRGRDRRPRKQQHQPQRLLGELNDLAVHVSTSARGHG